MRTWRSSSAVRPTPCTAWWVQSRSAWPATRRCRSLSCRRRSRAHRRRIRSGLSQTEPRHGSATGLNWYGQRLRNSRRDESLQARRNAPAGVRMSSLPRRVVRSAGSQPRADKHLAGKCRYRPGLTFEFPLFGPAPPGWYRSRACGVSGHERHELGGHGDEGAHHVAVFVFEDVAVVHVAAAVGGETDGDFGDLVGVDADGVLEAAFVVVDGVVELVAGVAFERDGGGNGEVFDAMVGDLVADGASGEDLERVEVDVDGVGVVGEVDQLPDLIPVEYREECCGVLEVGGGGAVAGGLLIVGDGDDGPGVVVAGDHEFPHGEHVGFAFEFALDERDRAAWRAGQRVRGRRAVVGGELAWDRRAARRAFYDAEAHDVRIRQHPAGICGAGGAGGGEGG